MTTVSTSTDEATRRDASALQRGVRPVATVERDGASVRLKWASVEAAHNAVIGPLYDQRALSAADREWFGELEAADAEIVRLRAALEHIASGELGVNMCVMTAQRALSGA